MLRMHPRNCLGSLWSFAFVVACAIAAPAWPAAGPLAGVTELRKAPDALTDAELAALLGERIRTADVVAIGETVHGSSGFLGVQTRLIQHLVAHHGLRLLVWETPTLRSLELARWVAGCAKGESRAPAPIDVLYMPTTSDLPLWRWVCDFNRARPDDPVVFRGMDVWDRPWEHFAQIESLAGRGGAPVAAVATIRASCPARGSGAWPKVDAVLGAVHRDGKFAEGAYAACRAALTAVLDAAAKTGIAARPTKGADADAAFELALSASTLLGWLGFHHHVVSDDVLSWNERDRAQARNLKLLMEKHGATRAILAAHTSHVSHNRSPADWWGFGDLKSGVHFFQALAGRKVFNIALTGYRVSGTQGEWLLPTAANSLDRTLHAAGHAFAFLASDAPFLAAHPRWWLQNGNAIGVENGIELVLKDHFDAVFFLGESLLDRALPARPMWQP